MAILPVLLVAVGAVTGAVVAEQTMSPPEEGAVAAEGGAEAPTEAQPSVDAELTADGDGDGEGETAGSETVVVELDRPLIVPIVTDRMRQGVLFLSIALELPAEASEMVRAAEPQLRDGFLRVLISLAAGGTFQNGVTDPAVLERMRTVLEERAVRVLPVDDVDILVTEVVKRPL
ncbi:MAG: flagellar basal body-associated FliL family protein [Pseudomonadota bacterium]